jgi:hypothetical protein
MEFIKYSVVVMLIRGKICLSFLIPILVALREGRYRRSAFGGISYLGRYSAGGQYWYTASP